MNGVEHPTERRAAAFGATDAQSKEMTSEADARHTLLAMGRSAREAARHLALASSRAKNLALAHMAQAIRQDAVLIERENEADLAAARTKDLISTLGGSQLGSLPTDEPSFAAFKTRIRLLGTNR